MNLRFSNANLSAALFALAVCHFPSETFAQKAPPNVPVAATSSMANVAAAATPPAYGYPTPPATPLVPFFASLVAFNTPVSAGVASGQLAITNIVLTNFDASAQQVFIFAPVFSPGGVCGDPVIGGSTPRMQLYVQPRQTLVIPFPTPLVFNKQKPNCIAVEVTTILNGGSVEMDVTGFQQFGIAYP